MIILNLQRYSFSPNCHIVQSLCAEAEEGEEGGADGESSGQEHGVMRSLVPEEMEEQGHKGGSDSLTCEAGRGKHTACAAGPVIGG